MQTLLMGSDVTDLWFRSSKIGMQRANIGLLHTNCL